MSFLANIFGDGNAAKLKPFYPVVERINALEPELLPLQSEALKGKTKALKERLAKGETLDGILPEAFALARESARRTLKERHFDVQLLGGMVLHNRGIAEMRTGEGKTLVATLPAYLNALSGEGVHVITVNDYLSRRDAVWMGQIYHLLGLSVGVINHDSSFMYDPAHVTEKSEIRNPKSETNSKSQIPNSKSDSNFDIRVSDLDRERDSLGSFRVVHEFLRPCSRKEAYAADITYGTNNELGFD